MCSCEPGYICNTCHYELETDYILKSTFEKFGSPIELYPPRNARTNWHPMRNSMLIRNKYKIPMKPKVVESVFVRVQYEALMAKRRLKRGYQ